jgi:hypothetical protein
MTDVCRFDFNSVGVTAFHCRSAVSSLGNDLAGGRRIPPTTASCATRRLDDLQFSGNEDGAGQKAGAAEHTMCD